MSDEGQLSDLSEGVGGEPQPVRRTHDIEVWMTSACAIELAQLADDVRLAAVALLARGDGETAKNYMALADRLTKIVIKARTR